MNTTELHFYETADFFVSEFRAYCQRVENGLLNNVSNYSVFLACVSAESEAALNALHGIKVLSLKSCIFFDTSGYVDQITILRDAAYQYGLHKPDYSGRPSPCASGAATGEGDNHQSSDDDIPDEAYTVDHVELDPDACPDCFGTGLDFTHHADFCHCLSCKITHQPGNPAPSAVGVVGLLQPIIV